MLALESCRLSLSSQGLKYGYGPNEGIGEESERFWNNLDRTVDRVGNEYRLCVLGHLNG